MADDYAIPVDMTDDQRRQVAALPQPLAPAIRVPAQAMPDLGQDPTRNPQLVNKFGHAIPVGRVEGIPGKLNPTEDGTPGTYNPVNPHLSKIASLWSDADNIHNPILRVLGKIGAGAARAADVGLSIVSPRIAAAIPGTTENAYYRDLGARQMKQQAAQTGLTEAQTREANDRADVMENPQPKEEDEGKTVTTDEGIYQWNPATHRYDVRVGNAPPKEETEGKTVTTDKGIFQWNPKTKAYDVPVGNAPQKPGNDFEQFYKDWLSDNNLPDSAHNRLMARKQFAIAGQPPQREPVTNVFIPDGKGGYTVQAVHAGSEVGPGAVTATGMNTINTPTSQMRNVAAQAGLVHEQMPALLREIDELGKDLGPVQGRWNEFMQGKLGTKDPRFAGLRADLLMMSSAVALMHARGRLPENLREEFDHAINAPQQTPENLKSTLQHIDEWVVKNRDAFSGTQNAPQAQPQGGHDAANPLGI